MMANATPRLSEVTGYVMYICEDCAEAEGGSGHQRRAAKRTFPAEATDMAYHGSMFNRGEW